MRAATNADFDNASRYIDIKLDIFFNGTNSTPLTVTKSDYLVDVDWLEEGSADSSKPFGVVSSNELSFRLYNKDGMFSPTDVTGPYHGQIKPNVPVILYIKPLYDLDEVEWVELGTYYVTGWDAQITGTYADVTANDAWYQIFSSMLPNHPISLDTTYKDFLDSFFVMLGQDVDVDDRLIESVPYAFVEGTVKDFMQDITAAALAYVTSSKQGIPLIGAFTGSGDLRATLTDANQIKAVSARQSIIRAYDGVEVRYYVPQISVIDKLMEITGVTVPVGLSALDNIALNKGPLWDVSMVSLQSPNNVTLSSFKATQWMISFVLNAVIESSVDIAVHGRIVDLNEFILSDDATKLLRVESKYIQDSTYAAFYKAIMSRFISDDAPLLSVSIRGNPLLSIGDKVLIKSDKYNLNFTGVIQRLAYKYTGGLSCEMLLLNTAILQGVRV